MLLTGCFGSLRPRTPPQSVDHRKVLTTASSSESLSLVDTDSSTPLSESTHSTDVATGSEGEGVDTAAVTPLRCGTLALTALERAALEAEMRALDDVPLFDGPWQRASPPHAAVPQLDMRVVHLMRAVGPRKVQVACSALAMKAPPAAAMAR
jgi:hypothetical protein